MNGWHWQTMVFTVLCISQFGNSLAIRSERTSFFTQGVFSNPFLLWTVVVSVVLQLAIIYFPPLQEIFHTEALTLIELLVAFLLSGVVFWAVELEKFILRKQWLVYN